VHHVPLLLFITIFEENLITKHPNMKNTYLIMFLLATVIATYFAVSSQFTYMWISIAFVWIGVLGVRAEEEKR